MAIELKDSVRKGWNRLEGYLRVLAFKTALSLPLLISPLMAETVNVNGTVKDKKNNSVENVDVSYGDKDSGVSGVDGGYHLQWIITGVDPDKTNISLDYQLEQNYPNPFNPSTTIKFKTTDKGLFVIYDILGHEIERKEVPEGGNYTAVWSGMNKQGNPVAAGLYIYSVQSENHRESKKMILLDGGRGGSLLTLNQDNRAYPSLNKIASSDTLRFEKDGITNLYLPISINKDTTIDVTVNNGPVFEESINDTILTVGDTLTFNLNDLFYNDDQSIYTSDFIVNDSLFKFIAAQPETLENILVYATDAFDSTLTDSSNKFSIYIRAQPNRPPVLVNPITLINTFEDSIVWIEKYYTENDTDGVFQDPDGDALVGYVNNLPEGFNYTNLDSTIRITSPENFNGTIDSIIVGVTDGEFSVETPPFSIIYAPVNDAPVVSNVLLTPANPSIIEDIISTYDFFDVEDDLDQSAREWYRNNILVPGVQGNIFPADSTAGSDSIKVIITPYDGQDYGEPKQSNFAVVQPTRTLTGTITDYFADVPADNILLISSIDSARTNAQGEFTLEAALAEEHIPILHPSILTSGTILPASPNDTSLTLYIARGDSANGIDSTYFRDWIVGNRQGSSAPPNGIYVSFTEETRNDTVWVGGHIIRPSDGLVVSYPFQNVAQLNEIAKTINEESNPLIYGPDITTIAIADSNFADSTSQFQYANMMVVPNEMFPAELDPIRNATTFRGSQTGLGFNVTIYGEDGVTVVGNSVILKTSLTPAQIDVIISEEFYESDKGGIESSFGYPSIIDELHGPEIVDPTPHDGRMRDWIVLMGPGATYPAFPKGFDPALIERHAPGVLEKIKVSKNLPVDFSKYHLDEATGLYLKIKK